ncbi:MAG: hypothetical protein ACQESR_21505, partial [Planctomycetota bacterium]
GAIWHWVILIAAGKYLQIADPQRDARILDSVWLLFGWIQGLGYCALIYGVYRAGLYAKNRPKKGER